MSDDTSIVVKLTALGDDFQSGINNALGTWTNFLGKMGSSPATFASVATAGTAVVGALFSMAKQAADYGEELGKMSKQTGISVEDLSLLKFAAEQSETNLNSLAAGVKFLQKNLVEAASGNKNAESSFRALGLSVEDLQKMSTTEQLMAFSDAIKDVEDPALRTKLAMDTMGRGALEMMPFLLEGSEGIAKLTGEAEKLGLQMSTEQAAQADQFNDSLSKLWAVVKQLGIDIGQYVIPAFQKLFEGLVILTNLVTSSLSLAFNTLALIFNVLVGSAGAVWRVLTEVSDALHITSGASEEAAKWNAVFAQQAEETAGKVAASFNSVVDVLTGTQQAYAGVNVTVKDNIKLTDEQRLAIMGGKSASGEAEKAEKQRANDFSALSKTSITDLNSVLEIKKGMSTYDAAAFAEYKKSMLELGAAETQEAQITADEKKRLREEGLTAYKSINNLMQQSAQGLSDAVKALWADQESSFARTWENALTVFVGVMAQMVAAAQAAARAIQSSMAAAMSGSSSGTAVELSVETLAPSSDQGAFFASGAYVTKATAAIVGEGGEPEWVLPESKLANFLQLSAQANVGAGGAAGATTIQQNFSFPNITSLQDLSVSQAEQMLKTTFRRAAENLGRNGYTWGMPSRI